MRKMLSDEEVQAKNYAEIAQRYGIRDPAVLEQLFSSVDPDRLVTVRIREYEGGREVERDVAFRSYDLSTLHDRACVIFVAPRESGKTVFAYQMLATKSYLPCGYVTSATDGANGYYHTIFPDRCVRDQYDPAYQMAIIEAQNDCAQIYRKELAENRLFDPRVCLVEDDIAYDRHVHADSALERVGVSGRHFQIFAIVCVQRMQRVSPTFRDNCDLIILYANDNETVKRDVWQQYGGSMTYQSFVSVWDTITKDPYTAMVLSCRGRDRYKPIEDRLFWFKAYTEEAVDAIIGGGKVNAKTGKVVRPPRFWWRFGKSCMQENAPAMSTHMDALPVDRATALDTKAGEEGDDGGRRWFGGRFEPSKLSISEWLFRRERTEEDTRRAADLDRIVSKIPKQE